MSSNIFAETTEIAPDQLIGTKWLGWSDLFNDRFSIEFINEKRCVYTSQPKKYPLTYDIIEGKLYISNITGAFELRGNMLFNNDLPVFEKTA
ncbi:MAG: hypothetical protein FWB86_01705 [Treponema sp.]|nr:hypothetical protein [Treponema sp.]MCL2250801.1 hypothetical protein [Treponema sp.]